MIRATLEDGVLPHAGQALPAIERVVLTAKLATLAGGPSPAQGTSWDRVFDEVPPEVGGLPCQAG